MSDPTNLELLHERNWLATELGYGEAKVGDMGVGQGQADIHYERAGRRWHITLRASATAEAASWA